MLIYIAEMCGQVEKLEVNSEAVSDRSITQVFIKMTQLKYIDISACPNVLGVAL